MRHLLLSLPLVLAACGGGSGGGSNATPDPQAPLALTVNTGLAIAPGFTEPAALGRHILLQVRERDMNEDRNADGDMDDWVLARVDTLTDEAMNLGFAAIGPVLASDVHFAFLVPETDQSRTDLNLDGDILDSVWFVYDPAKPLSVTNPVNTGIATPKLGTPGAATKGGFVFLESEAAQGLLLNGDFDMTDHVLAVYDGSAMARISLGAWTYAPGTAMVPRAGRILVALGEPNSSADLNRDNDSNDIVLVCVDFTHSPAVLHPVGGIFPRAVGQRPYALTDSAAVYFVDEASEGGGDRNNDGDNLDGVLAVYKMGNGLGEHFPRSSQVNSLAVAGSPTVGIGTAAERAVIGVSEATQGARDLNGDGDSFDTVLAWVDVTGAPGTLHILPYTVGSHTPAVSGTRALVEVDEMASSAIVGVDLNGDLDTIDRVAFLLDMETPPGRMTNLGFAQSLLQLDGDDALVSVTEAGHFGIDMNGNGRTDDVVRVYFDVSDDPPTMRSLGLIATAARFFRFGPGDVRVAALAPEGQSSTLDDLNSDGDESDTCLLLVGIDPRPNPPVTQPTTPFFAGTAGFFPVDPLRVGDRVFAFPTSEMQVGLDLTGDGDAQDTILSFCRYRDEGD
ncbi:MAG: hypothetical protein ACYTGV_05495 [Planctomycetota bacterium]